LLNDTMSHGVGSASTSEENASQASRFRLKADFVVRQSSRLHAIPYVSGASQRTSVSHTW
jgi:hypothetical protein